MTYFSDDYHHLLFRFRLDQKRRHMPQCQASSFAFLANRVESFTQTPDQKSALRDVGFIWHCES